MIIGYSRGKTHVYMQLSHFNDYWILTWKDTCLHVCRLKIKLMVQVGAAHTVTFTMSYSCNRAEEWRFQRGAQGAQAPP